VTGVKWAGARFHAIGRGRTDEIGETELVGIIGKFEINPKMIPIFFLAFEKSAENFLIDHLLT
jgi:hypothetical protein